MSAETAKRWFGRVMWVGIAANLALALPTMAAPSLMLDMSRLPTATPEMWVRFSGLLLVLLSVFYMAPALDPDRYRAAAWMSVGSRLAGVLFFMIESEYRLFGLFAGGSRRSRNVGTDPLWRYGARAQIPSSGWFA